ncbi:MAG: enoyl-CoA hydratase [Acidimicrobiaceae bacterium]|nr:enoyl-CoA hydratase [Acidimicrobiaceae bacterium]
MNNDANGEPGSPLALTIDRGLATIRLCQPPANALGSALVAALNGALDEIERAGAGAVVIRSTVPNVFAAGADLKLLSTLDRADFGRYLVDLRHAIERLATLGPPTVAAIDGYALGGGLELAMACTMRIASPASRLGLPEVKLGLLPGAGGTQRLPRLVGRGPALDLLLTGKPHVAADAERIGLVDLIVDSDDIVTEAERIGRAFADGPAAALRAIIRCVDAARDLPLAAGMEVEADAVLDLFETADAIEGISAFLDKRAPTFSKRHPDQ